jgi:two-component system, sensor histidine kinase PdtaS
MKEYIEQLSRDLSLVHLTKKNEIQIILNVENIMMDVDTAIPLGLIINELLTNSMKHAFPDNQKGVIKVNLKKTKDYELLLVVEDSGAGISPDFNVDTSDSLGMKLIYNLTTQINGKLEFNGQDGAHFSIKFRERAPGRSK